MAKRILDVLVFSSLWVSAAAVALYAAAALAGGAAVAVSSAVLIACGTLVVYNVDRLCDLERDCLTAPERSAFVSEHRRFLQFVVGFSGLVSAVCAAGLDRGAVALLAVVLTFGLLHRRLKRFPFLKAAYLAGSWLAVVVGLAAIRTPTNARWVWISVVLGAALFANAIACSGHDGKSGAALPGAGLELRTARYAAVFGIAVGLIAPAPVRILSAAPAATLAALFRFRFDERYELVFLDGALLAGGLLAALVLGAGLHLQVP